MKIDKEKQIEQVTIEGVEVEENATKPVKKVEKKSEPKKDDYKESIFEWKKKYGSVFKTRVAGKDYIWRKIKRSEYTSIMVEVENEDPEERYYKRQEEVTKMTLLFPENVEDLIEENGGLASVISGEVLNKSGFEVAPVTDEL